MSKLSSSFVESVTRRAPASSFVTLVRVCSSMSCASHQPAGRNHVSSRDSFPVR